MTVQLLTHIWDRVLFNTSETKVKNKQENQIHKSMPVPSMRVILYKTTFYHKPVAAILYELQNLVFK